MQQLPPANGAYLGVTPHLLRGLAISGCRHEDGMTTSEKAFSLVELSIVLVILGLLTGGILAGQSLIRAAELRSVPQDLARVQTAIMSFRDKYMALPGDMPNATAFWGAAHATPATCRTTSTTTAATCDGNGDGNIYPMDGVTYSENFHAWKHLANAGLMEGSYTGVAGTAAAWDADIGVNVPKGKIANSGLDLQYSGTAAAGDTTWFEGSYGNNILYGTASTGFSNGAIFKPEEQWNIDIKMDDGRPGMGKIRSYEIYTTCNTTTVASTAEYALTTNSKTCSVIYTLK